MAMISGGAKIFGLGGPRIKGTTLFGWDQFDRFLCFILDTQLIYNALFTITVYMNLKRISHQVCKANK